MYARSIAPHMYTDDRPARTARHTNSTAGAGRSAAVGRVRACVCVHVCAYAGMRLFVCTSAHVGMMLARLIIFRSCAWLLSDVGESKV